MVKVIERYSGTERRAVRKTILPLSGVIVVKVEIIFLRNSGVLETEMFEGRAKDTNIKRNFSKAYKEAVLNALVKAQMSYYDVGSKEAMDNPTRNINEWRITEYWIEYDYLEEYIVKTKIDRRYRKGRQRRVKIYDEYTGKLYRNVKFDYVRDVEAKGSEVSVDDL